MSLKQIPSSYYKSSRISRYFAIKYSIEVRYSGWILCLAPITSSSQISINGRLSTVYFSCSTFVPAIVCTLVFDFSKLHIVCRPPASRRWPSTCALRCLCPSRYATGCTLMGACALFYVHSIFFLGFDATISSAASNLSSRPKGSVASSFIFSEPECTHSRLASVCTSSLELP